MNVEEQKIIVRVNNFNEEHFKSLGYIVKRNDYIEIFVNELPVGSGLKIDVECNYCGMIFKKAFRRYLETKDNICCNKCRSIKMMETSIDRYGNKCSLRNEEVQNKSKETNIKNLGVEYPFQNKEILKKCKISTIEKYGSGVLTKNISKQQERLHYLYGGILNFSIFPFTLDIFFEKENIYLEYDGSGHDMCIKMKRMTKEQFDEKEIKREEFLYGLGYKEFRFESKLDILPDDKILLEIKERAFDLLLIKNYQKYIYNLDTKTESFEE